MELGIWTAKLFLCNFVLLFVAARDDPLVPYEVHDPTSEENLKHSNDRKPGLRSGEYFNGDESETIITSDKVVPEFENTEPVIKNVSHKQVDTAAADSLPDSTPEGESSAVEQGETDENQAEYPCDVEQSDGEQTDNQGATDHQPEESANVANEATTAENATEKHSEKATHPNKDAKKHKHDHRTAKKNQKHKKHHFPKKGSAEYKDLVEDYKMCNRFVEDVYHDRQSANISISQYLLFYRFRQQANEGDCQQEKPLKIMYVEYLMWESWTEGKGMPRNEAMARYVMLTSSICPDWYKAYNYTPKSKYAKIRKSGQATASRRSPARTKDCLSMLKKFKQAALFVRKTPPDASKQITDADRLQFYKYYKQAMDGDCNVPKPPFYKFVERSKWEAWNSIRGMAPVEAEEAYLKMLDSIVPNWQDYAEEQYAKDDV